MATTRQHAYAHDPHHRPPVASADAERIARSVDRLTGAVELVGTGLGRRLAELTGEVDARAAALSALPTAPRGVRA